MDIIKIIKIIFKHKQLCRSRDRSQKRNFIFLIGLAIPLIMMYLFFYLLFPYEYIHFFFLIVLLIDFVLKLLFKRENINILPYLVLPLNKKMLIKAILFLDTVNVWNIYCFISILFLPVANFFSTDHFSLSSTGLSINLYLLFIFNSYYIMAINSTLSKIIAFILLPVLLLFAFPVYLLLYGGWWGTVIIFILTQFLVYSDIYLINNKIYKQLNERAF